MLTTESVKLSYKGNEFIISRQVGPEGQKLIGFQARAMNDSKFGPIRQFGAGSPMTTARILYANIYGHAVRNNRAEEENLEKIKQALLEVTA